MAEDMRIIMPMNPRMKKLRVGGPVGFGSWISLRTGVMYGSCTLVGAVDGWKALPASTQFLQWVLPITWISQSLHTPIPQETQTPTASLVVCLAHFNLDSSN